MPRSFEVKVHAIAEDGIPDMDDRSLTGRVALIFDGCIVSGWPLDPDEDSDGPHIDLWEADRDVGHHRPFGGVTHWVEFPAPVWEMVKTE